MITSLIRESLLTTWVCNYIFMLRVDFIVLLVQYKEPVPRIVLSQVGESPRINSTKAEKAR